MRPLEKAEAKDQRGMNTPSRDLCYEPCCKALKHTASSAHSKQGSLSADDDDDGDEKMRQY